MNCSKCNCELIYDVDSYQGYCPNCKAYKDVYLVPDDRIYNIQNPGTVLSKEVADRLRRLTGQNPEDVSQWQIDFCTTFGEEIDEFLADLVNPKSERRKTYIRDVYGTVYRCKKCDSYFAPNDLNSCPYCEED